MKNIFVHGLGQNASSWDKTLGHLNENPDSFCPELSKMAAEGEPVYENIYRKFSEYCNDFTDLLNICGMSLGGVLALNYGIENPGKINSLVLIGAQYKMPKALLKFQNLIFRLMPDSSFGKVGFGKREFIALSKSMMKLDFSADLEKVSFPVMIICGENDKANRKASVRMSEAIRNSEFRTVGNSGHEVNVDNPEALSDLLNGFWNKVGRSNA